MAIEAETNGYLSNNVNLVDATTNGSMAHDTWYMVQGIHIVSSQTRRLHSLQRE